MAGWEIQKSFIMYPKDWNTLEFTKSSQMALSTCITDDCYLSFINTSSEMNTENKKNVEDENTLLDFISFLSDLAASASCSYLVSLQYPSSSHQSTSARTPSRALKQ